MSMHRNCDVEPTAMRRTAEITPQNTLHDFFIGVGSGVCDATVPAGAQGQTNAIPRDRDSLSYHYAPFEHPLNQPYISYGKYSY
jgi:hypothetical protein